MLQQQASPTSATQASAITHRLNWPSSIASRCPQRPRTAGNVSRKQVAGRSSCVTERHVVPVPNPSRIAECARKATGIRQEPYLSGGELAFAGNALKRFSRALDPILAIVAFSRQLTHDFISAAGSRARNVARREVDRLTNTVFVCHNTLSCLTPKAGKPSETRSVQPTP